jgi:hypothetical protein
MAMIDRGTAAEGTCPAAHFIGAERPADVTTLSPTTRKARP